MGKCCLQASMFIFDWIFNELAGNQDRHKILDKFEFRPECQNNSLYTYTFSKTSWPVLVKFYV